MTLRHGCILLKVCMMKYPHCRSISWKTLRPLGETFRLPWGPSRAAMPPGMAEGALLVWQHSPCATSWASLRGTVMMMTSVGASSAAESRSQTPKTLALGPRQMTRGTSLKWMARVMTQHPLTQSQTQRQSGMMTGSVSTPMRQIARTGRASEQNLAQPWELGGSG